MDSVYINGDEYADAVANNAYGADYHAMVPGISQALIDTATETTTGHLSTFVIDLPSSDFWTVAWDAIMNVYG